MALSKTEKTSQITKSISVDDDAPSNAVTIDDDGRVGIGVTPAAVASDTANLQFGSSFLTHFGMSDGGTASLGNNIYWDGSNNRALYADATSTYHQYNGQHVFYNGPSVSAGAVATNNERMRIDGSGSLLVGNTTGASADGGHIFISNGMAFHVRDGGVSLVVDRQTSDGDIVEFRKDGSTVGSIGTSNTVAYICLLYTSDAADE